ncbi:prephenate dehydratase [Variovorax boronicumulans]|uniref:prephenate dehydratase n=1 Tax=Variovorax boronicumulans TaxID=436515 RepID=UPI00277D8542|nr:prephenate dehydratase domain-containing protein [Variovorax boronicumulans]MDP9912530.1 prephenate dehydratase [Variovorax boronicumulans]
MAALRESACRASVAGRVRCPDHRAFCREDVRASSAWIAMRSWRAVAAGAFRSTVVAVQAVKIMKPLSLGVATIATLAMGVSCVASAQIAYLGPAGSWTHQACMDLFGETNLVALDRQTLFKALSEKTVAKACVPVTTSVVGTTPYLDDVLAVDGVHVVAEYPKALGYSLLAKPGTHKEDIRTVLAHPVALEEVKPWLDLEMPDVKRQPAASGGAAAKSVAEGVASDIAAMGPPSAARLYGLAPIVNGIEEGPHNTTRWWVLGRALPAPSGNDKTTLLLTVDEAGFHRSLQALAQSAQVLALYERPGKRSLDGHRYVVDVVGHASQPKIARLLADHAQFRLLGSYPRRY